MALPTIKSFFVSILCVFIPTKALRIKFRAHLFRYERDLEKKLTLLYNAVADPNGFGMLTFRCVNAGVRENYKYIFFDIKSSDLCIDCGANAGLITDIILMAGGGNRKRYSSGRFLARAA